METIKVQYTNPVTGIDNIDTIKFDVLKYRKDESSLPFEDVFFTAASSLVPALTSVRDIPDFLSASLGANPFNPYACSIHPVVYGLVDSVTTNDIALTKNPQTLGFEANVPLAILANFSSTTPIAYLIPTSVGTTALTFASDVSGLSIKKNAVVVKLGLPTPVVPFFSNENTMWGIKTLLERPMAPTVDGTASGSSINVTVVAPTSTSGIIAEYYVYIVKSTEWNAITQPVIHGNRKPDAVLLPGALSTTVSTYGGGTTYGGGSTATGNTYYIVAISKDSTESTLVNCSYLSNIDTVTL